MKKKLAISTLIPLAIALFCFLLLTAAFDRPYLTFLGERLGLPHRDEKKALLATLKVYNKILQDFYASNGVPALIDNFPAAKVIKHEIFRDLGFLRQNDRVLIYDHAETTPMEVKITDPVTAEVLLYEDWNYAYQRLRDRKPNSLVKGTGHGFRYYLQRGRRGWMVMKWDAEEVKAPPKSNEFYF